MLKNSIQRKDAFPLSPSLRRSSIDRGNTEGGGEGELLTNKNMKDKKHTLEENLKKAIVSPKKFRHGDSYIFPFEVLDKTLGRIEWHIELVPDSRKKDGRYYYSKLYIWTSQTYDKRYDKKVFEIPCYTECITGGGFRTTDFFINQVWRIRVCDLHKNTIFSAYPKNEHTKLIIPVDSSISIEPYFE